MNLTKQFWEDTYRNNIGKLKAVCYRYVQNQHIAEDIAQDAFITAIEKANTYKGRGAFDAWLRRIAVNSALQYLRTQKQNKPFDDWMQNEQNIMETTDEQNPKTLIEQADFSHDELLEAVNELPEHHKLVFNLYVIDGFTHIQIGKELNISAGTSKSHLARARKKLKQNLLEKAQLEQTRKKKKRAFLWLFFAGKNSYIDKIYKQKFSDYELLVEGVLNYNKLNWGNTIIPNKHKGLLTFTNLFLSTAAIGGAAALILLNLTIPNKTYLIPASANIADTFQINKTDTLKTDTTHYPLIIITDTIIRKKTVVQKKTRVIHKKVYINETIRR